MRFKWAIAALPSLALSINGCSGTQPSPDAKKVFFGTRITANNLKQFETRLNTKWLKMPMTLSSREHVRQTSHRVRERTKRHSKLLADQTEKFVNELAYCRQGFWVIDKNPYNSEPYLRGECNETASSSDLERFPNTLSEW